MTLHALVVRLSLFVLTNKWVSFKAFKQKWMCCYELINNDAIHFRMHSSQKLHNFSFTDRNFLVVSFVASLVKFFRCITSTRSRAWITYSFMLRPSFGIEEKSWWGSIIKKFFSIRPSLLSKKKVDEALLSRTWSCCFCLARLQPFKYYQD